MIYKLIFLAFVMMILSSLFGCKIPLFHGPDFSNSTEKYIYIKPLVNVEYLMPGNMSSSFGFADKYAKESEVTRSIDLSISNNFETFNWRNSIDVDGAKWDYTESKNKKINGEIGSLIVQIDIAQLPFSSSFSDSITDLYNNYLNGDFGLNTEVRKSDFAAGREDDELSRWILPAPKSLVKTQVNSNEFYMWDFNDEARGHFSKNYAMPLDDKTFLLFEFRYAISVDSDKKFRGIRKAMFNDIGEFMSKVILTKK